MSTPLSPFVFGTKAETLERLAGRLTRSTVPGFVYFTTAEWQSNCDGVHRRLRERFEGRTVIVRSSARGEDGAERSLAGQFESVPSVPAGEREHLHRAIESVLSSYRTRGAGELAANHVLVQEMIGDAVMSGVLFTQDLATGAPYYVINYDDETGRTDTVTGGGEYSNRTLYVHRGAVEALRSPRFRALVDAVAEIEQVIGSNSLDVEFAVAADLSVHLLQVRRIATQPNWNRHVAQRVDDAIEPIRRFVRERLRPMAGARGRRTALGQMPDWNPAEMIGRAPRPLALSLYRRLITDRTWRVARAAMGYAHPQGHALMVSLAGQPFIDVRLSFSSFLPASLPAAIGDKLVDAWIDRLEQNQHLHDKVEFDVAVTALDFTFDQHVAEQFPSALSAAELRTFRAALRDLTVPLVQGSAASVASQMALVDRLASRPRLPPGAGLAAVAGMLEDCTELGTVPFAIVARHAFIAQSLLRSLVSLGILRQSDVDALLRSIGTVTRELTEDARSVSAGTMPRAVFLARYGHLRPGTYDILSPRYDQREALFGERASEPAPVEPPFVLQPDQAAAIDRLLAKDKFGVTADQLFAYIRDATVARERAKFVFTRLISDALEHIAEWGAEVGLSREELSYLEIDDILAAQVHARDPGTERVLRDAAEDGRRRQETTVALRLPQILFDEVAVHIVPLRLSVPNFITHALVRGHCLRLTAYDDQPDGMAGAVVLIENADPGFDWIFAHRIGGLVTKYGGANSHMAIRCAEFGIPAAIGCGEQIFERVAQSGAVELNCAERHIRPLDARL